ncbi:hypothetical protein KQI41_01280 [Tissierella pigra]|nr:hypothetical protein [Tissierella pigra]MBU5425028.1 hypothetical protein [Tissierella pigra]
MKEKIIENKKYIIAIIIAFTIGYAVGILITYNSLSNLLKKYNLEFIL